MNPKILIVDDDRDLVEILKTRLESQGFDTISAYEGVRALDEAHRGKPDLIILDWKMPAGQGGYVLEMLAKSKETKNIPVIVLTACNPLDVKDRAIKLGAKAFISKPYNPEELLGKIDELLGWVNK